MTLSVECLVLPRHELNPEETASPTQCHKMPISIARSIPMLPQSRHDRGSVLTAFFMISLNCSICIRKSSQANFAAFILPFRQPRLNEVPCMCPTRMDSTIIEAVLTSWMPPHHIGMLVERHAFRRACHAVRLGQLDGRLRCWCCNNWIGFVNQVFRIFIKCLSLLSPLICWRAKFFEGRHLILRSGRNGLHPFQAKQCFLPTPCRTTLRMWCKLNGLSNVSFGHEAMKQPQRQLQSWNWSGTEAPGTAWTQNNCTRTRKRGMNCNKTIAMWCSATWAHQLQCEHSTAFCLAHALTKRHMLPESI